MTQALATLLAEVHHCRHCAAQLPHDPRPVLQLGRGARLLIAGQAPGRRVHASGIPFDDASGERLRDWLGVDRQTFYDPDQVAILPMGFCYPGAGRSGDNPPRPECAPLWRARLLAQLPDLKLTLVIGQYAMDYHLPQRPGALTDTVRNWRAYLPAVMPLPHPSPRNNIWLKKNPWFGEELLPELRRRVAQALVGATSVANGQATGARRIRD